MAFIMRSLPFQLILLAAVLAGCDDNETPAQPGQVKSATGPAAADTARPARASFDPEKVQADVQRMHDAIYGEELDVETLLELTYPPIIQSLGGHEKARTALTEGLTEIRSSGIEVEVLEFPAEPEFIPGTTRDFVIVPTRTVFRSGDRRAESGNFQFGIRLSGQRRWTYVEGSRLTPEVMKQLFPEFPPHVQLPETYRRPIEE
jgi:hypothetical protein